MLSSNGPELRPKPGRRDRAAAAAADGSQYMRSEGKGTFEARARPPTQTHTPLSHSSTQEKGKDSSGSLIDEKTDGKRENDGWKEEGGYPSFSHPPPSLLCLRALHNHTPHFSLVGGESW